MVNPSATDLNKSIGHVAYFGCYKLVGAENEPYYKKLLSEIAPDFYTYHDCISKA